VIGCRAIRRKAERRTDEVYLVQDCAGQLVLATEEVRVVRTEAKAAKLLVVRGGGLMSTRTPEEWIKDAANKYTPEEKEAIQELEDFMVDIRRYSGREGIHAKLMEWILKMDALAVLMGYNEQMTQAGCPFVMCLSDKIREIVCEFHIKHKGKLPKFLALISENSRIRDMAETVYKQQDGMFWTLFREKHPNLL
jgi:hypothetical protein